MAQSSSCKSKVEGEVIDPLGVVCVCVYYFFLWIFFFN
jgi:hypothetical protein